MSEEESSAGSGATTDSAAAPGGTSGPPAPATSPPPDPGAAPDGAGQEEAARESRTSDGASGSDRQKHVRAGGALFGGDSVAGSKFVYNLVTGEESKPPTRLPSRLIRLARHAFVPPVGWDALRDDFRHRRTVVLRGSPGSGRTAMAIRLLQSVEAGAIYLLDPRADLARIADRLTAHPIERGTAFLCAPEAVDELDGYTFESLEAALEAADARLVVTVGTDHALRHNDLLRHQIDLPIAPGPREILRQHLAYHLEDEIRAQGILDGAAVEALVAELLDGTVTCEVTAVLADVLSRAPEPVDVTWVRANMTQLRLDSFDSWFANLEEPDVRAFAIALAVLNDSPYVDVVDAARRLRARLDDAGETITLAGDGTLRTKGDDPFQLGLRPLLRRLNAQTTERTGGIPAMTVAFRDDDYAPEVLRRVWHHFRIQDELLAWLEDLVDNGNLQTRVRAGLALGLFAQFSFPYVRDTVLTPWAIGGLVRRQEAVADALGLAVAEPGLRGPVTKLVRGWYANRADVELQYTAARVYGGALSPSDPPGAIAALRRLTMVDHPVLHAGIGQGFADLLARRPDEARQLTLPVYEAIWSCMADPARAVAGHVAFLIPADSLTTEARDDEPVWPALLYLAAHHADLRIPLSALWARVLTEGFATKSADQVLRRWAEYAEDDPSIRDAFVRMARGIRSQDERAGKILAHLARDWDSDDELLPLPVTAAAVHDVLID